MVLQFGEYNNFLIKTATPILFITNFPFKLVQFVFTKQLRSIFKVHGLRETSACFGIVSCFLYSFFLKLNKEIAFLFSRVLRCFLFFECTKSFQTILCRYHLRKQMSKISATRNYEVLFVLAALFLILFLLFRYVSKCQA